MPKPSSKPRRNPAKLTEPEPLEIVDPRWLLKAGAVVCAFALLCVLALFWTAFYYTQWQYVLAPSRSVATNPSAASLSFSEVHFGADATGQPQLDGWWIPSDTPTSPTVLLLHDGKGSMSDALPQARNLHEANLNVLVFDYRGFGRSGGKHPTEHFMQEDAQAALTYLLTILHVPAAQIVIVGEGIGASLATTLATDHPELRSLILINAEGDIDRRLATDSRAQLVPAHLLFHEEFPLAAPLATLATPKLLLTRTTGPAPETLRQAAAPKTTVELPPTAPRQETLDAITRFLSDR